MFRFLTAGESHGPALTVIVEGMPAGVPVELKFISDELARRRLGYGRGPRMKIEADALELLSGVRHGKTLGSPISVVIRNSEWSKWEKVMSPQGPPGGGAVLTEPRPGHADLAGMLKYGFSDARNVLERASARETAARTAAGAVAKMLLGELGVSVISHVVSVGAAAARGDIRPKPSDLEAIDASPLRCLDEEATKAMIAEIEAAEQEGDSLGGVIEVIAYGVPPGLGSYVHWDRRIDARLGYALMSIPAIKAVEIGDGFSVAGLRGSQSHDEIFYEEGEYRRHTDRAGGTEGGSTNGQPLRMRAAMKPLSTLKRPLKTVDVNTKQQVSAFKERTDVCAVPAAGVVGEAVVALVLAEAFLEKFGSDSLSDIQGALEAYRARIA